MPEDERTGDGGGPGPETNEPNEPNFGTPYDDVFKTLLVDHTPLILPLLNDVFGERYTGRERIEFRSGEHFITQPNGTRRKRVTDSHFVVWGDVCRAYVVECQTNLDGSILIRIFEYALSAALEGSTLEGDILTVPFPRTALLCLRSRESTPEEMQVRILFPEGEAVTYNVPVIRAQGYALEEIFEKGLYFLLPFHIFSHERRFGEYEADEAKLRDLQREYEMIASRLEALSERGKLTEYERATLLEMSRKVVESLARRYERVREGVRSVMGGTVLEYEAKTAYRQGIAEGLAEGEARGKRAGIAEGEARGKRAGIAEGKRAGIAEGEARGIAATARQLLSMGVLTVKQIAQATGLSPAEVEKLREDGPTE